MKRKGIALLCAMTLLMGLLALPVYADAGRSVHPTLPQTPGGAAHSHSAGLFAASDAPEPKPIIWTVKLHLSGGKATATPPVRSALKFYGIDIDRFMKEFAERSKRYTGLMVPVVITVYKDHSFTFIIKTPPASVHILKPGRLDPKGGPKIGSVSKEDFRHIVEHGPGKGPGGR